MDDDESAITEIAAPTVVHTTEDAELFGATGDQDTTEAMAMVSIENTAAPAAAAPPKPSSSAAAASDSNRSSTVSPLKTPNPWDTFPSMFDIKVADPEKKGEGMNAHVVYTVIAKTTSSDYQNPSMNVARRFTNFVWLYNQLTTKYPGVIVPPIPEKQALGRFETEFLEQRRAALEKCLRRISAHPILSKSPDFKMFLESSDLEGDIKKKEPKKSLFTAITASMTDVVQNAASTFSKIPESDEWFENKRAQLETLETQLKALLKVVQTFIKQRKELAAATGEFGGSVASLGSSEFSKSLGACLGHLGDLEKKIEEILNQQATSDEENLESVVDEYVRTIGSIKLALESRVKVYTAWKTAESTLAKKKEQLAKLTQSGKGKSNIEAEVEEAEKAVEKTKQSFDEISEVLKKDLGRFDHEKIEDFQQGLVKFVEKMVENQKMVVALWESYLPEVQAL